MSLPRPLSLQHHYRAFIATTRQSAPLRRIGTFGLAVVAACAFSLGIAGQVEYQSKDEKETKVFNAQEWLAAMCSHVPDKGEQMARYYGHYSNVARGKRKKAGTEDKIPCILEPELTGTAFRKN